MRATEYLLPMNWKHPFLDSYQKLSKIVFWLMTLFGANITSSRMTLPYEHLTALAGQDDGRT
jgi:hypothetical protein